jgi:hypothetical protein
MGSLFRQKGLWAAQGCHIFPLIISTRFEIQSRVSVLLFVNEVETSKVRRLDEMVQSFVMARCCRKASIAAVHLQFTHRSSALPNSVQR